MSKEESEERIGAVIEEKWELEELIGYSPIAATYRARHRNGIEMAVKVIHRAHCEHEVLLARFLEESQLANRIDHAGVEKVLDDGVTPDGCLYLVMDLLVGETLELRRMEAGGHLTLGESRKIFDGFFDALIAVHEAGIIHRALRPGNVFLARDGRVVITDFGRARLAGGERVSVSLDSLVPVSPSYLAPEQARGRPREVDERSDIWAAGAILFTVLTGRLVHDAPTPKERMALAQTRAAPRLATLLKGASPALAEVVDRALAFDRGTRWASAEAMRRAWWLATGRPESTLPPKRRRRMPTPSEIDDARTDPDGVPVYAYDERASHLPEDPERPHIVQDLHPPVIDAFVEVVKPKRRIRVLPFFYGLLALALFAGAVALAWFEIKKRI